MELVFWWRETCSKRINLHYVKWLKKKAIRRKIRLGEGMEGDCEVVRKLFREKLSEEVTFNQNFECSERVSCVLRKSVGEGTASAKVLSWCPLWPSIQRWGLIRS